MIDEQMTRVTPSSPDTAWLFEGKKMPYDDLQHMPPGERAAFAAGFRRGHEVAIHEIERLRNSVGTRPDTPVMDQSKLSGLADGQRRPPAEVCVPNSGFDSRDGGQSSNVLQSQLDFIAPYYSPVADAKARIRELEAALRQLVADYKTTMERDARLIDRLDTVGRYLAGKTADEDARHAYAALLYVRSTLNLDAEEYRRAQTPQDRTTP